MLYLLRFVTALALLAYTAYEIWAWCVVRFNEKARPGLMYEPGVGCFFVVPATLVMTMLLVGFGWIAPTVILVVFLIVMLRLGVIAADRGKQAADRPGWLAQNARDPRTLFRAWAVDYAARRAKSDPDQMLPILVDAILDPEYEIAVRAKEALFSWRPKTLYELVVHYLAPGGPGYKQRPVIGPADSAAYLPILMDALERQWSKWSAAQLLCLMNGQDVTDVLVALVADRSCAGVTQDMIVDHIKVQSNDQGVDRCVSLLLDARSTGSSYDKYRLLMDLIAARAAALEVHTLQRLATLEDFEEPKLEVFSIGEDMESDVTEVRQVGFKYRDCSAIRAAAQRILRARTIRPEE